MGVHKGKRGFSERKQSIRLGANIYSRKDIKSLGLGFGFKSINRRRERMVRRADNLTTYGMRLAAAQIIRFWYGGLSRGELLALLDKAESAPGNLIENLILGLETRVAVIIYRSGLSWTMRQAMSWVRSGHVSVDGRIVRDVRFMLRPGQEIQLNRELVSSSHKTGERFQKRSVMPSAAWLETARSVGWVCLVRLPSLSEISHPVSSPGGFFWKKRMVAQMHRFRWQREWPTLLERFYYGRNN